MNIITARMQRNQTRQRVLDGMDRGDYQLYKNAETGYHRQLAVIRDAAMVLCAIGGAALALFGILDGPTSVAVAGVALVLVGLVLTLANMAERGRVTSRAEDRINATMTEMLDNEDARRRD